MVQSRLDPEAEEAARVGGWGILRKQRSTKSVKLRLAQVARFLDGLDTGSDPKVSEATDDKKPASRHRWTVWFNAWKYETSEQLWAGLVDAIVTQITDRLRPDQRELFLLRLNLARLRRFDPPFYDFRRASDCSVTRGISQKPENRL